MNGIRMNQSVAPTSFITSISRRRAKIAVRIVFQISSTAANSRKPDSSSKRNPKKLCSCEIRLIWSSANFTSYTLGSSSNAVESWRSRSMSVPSVGTALNCVVMLLSSSRSRTPGSPASTRSASSSEHVASQNVKLSMNSVLFAEHPLDQCELVGCRRRTHEHDHLDAALPSGEQVVERVLAEQRQADAEQRDRGGDDGRDGEGGVAAETVERLAQGVSKSGPHVVRSAHS